MARSIWGIPSALLLAGIWSIPLTNPAIAGHADKTGTATATATESTYQRQLVTPPPGFTTACRSNRWLCAQSAEGRLSQSALLETAQRVNQQVNRAVREMTDVENYGSADYWTLPANGRGDCEDFVMEKYKRLLAAGADSRDLSVAVVLDRDGNNHAVLVLRHAQGDLVLDSLTRGIRPWNETGYRFLAMQTSDDKLAWEVVMHQPRDRNVLAQR